MYDGCTTSKKDHIQSTPVIQSLIFLTLDVYVALAYLTLVIDVTVTSHNT